MFEKKIIFILFIGLVLSSCVSHQKLLTLPPTKGSDNIITHRSSPYLIQPGDILDVKVSSIDPQSVAVFNKEIGNHSNQVNPASIYLNGYSVSDSGSISLPLIGIIKVINLNISTIRDTIESKLKPYYKYVSVDVKLMSFRVTVLGEVPSQGTFNIYYDQANILQVIGLAGGITDYGNRKKVTIARKKGDKSVLVNLNLTSPDLIASEYFYLQSNDIIYVEPLKAKPLRINAPAVQIALSALAFVIVLLNFINRK